VKCPHPMPMKKTIQILSIILFGAVLVSAATEEDAELWALTSKNILGSVEIKVKARLDPVQEAFESVLAQLAFTATRTKKKEVEAVLTFRGADNEKVTVKLKEFPDYTNIKIRIGWMGNGPLSREVLKRVYLQL